MYKPVNAEWNKDRDKLILEKRSVLSMLNIRLHIFVKRCSIVKDPTKERQVIRGCGRYFVFRAVQAGLQLVILFTQPPRT